MADSFLLVALLAITIANFYNERLFTILPLVTRPQERIFQAVY